MGWKKKQHNNGNLSDNCHSSCQNDNDKSGQWDERGQPQIQTLTVKPQTMPTTLRPALEP